MPPPPPCGALSNTINGVVDGSGNYTNGAVSVVGCGNVVDGLNVTVRGYNNTVHANTVAAGQGVLVIANASFIVNSASRLVRQTRRGT